MKITQNEIVCNEHTFKLLGIAPGFVNTVASSLQRAKTDTIPKKTRFAIPR